MFGAGYSQFMETGTDPGKFRSSGYQTNYNQTPLNNFTFKIDLHDNQEDVIFGKNFIKMSYPVDFAMVNAFCPMCGKFVAEGDRHLTYQSKNYGKKFLAHEDCLNKQQSASFLSAAYDEDEQAKIIPFGLKKDQKSMPIGGQQFYLQMKITHPLSDFTFMKLSSKISAIANTLTWQLHRQQESDCYLPNIICFPLSDFKLALTLTSMTTGQKTTSKSYVNLGRLKYNQIKVITAKTQDIHIEMKIYYDLEQKQKLTDQMNYKYKYSLKLPLPIVQLVTIQTKVPEQDQESENQNVNESKSAIQEIINQGTSYSSTLKTVSFHNTNRQQTNSLYGSDILSEKSYEKEKIDLQRLISNDVLGVYVRNNTQSRQFQNFLNEASQGQVDQIIKTLYLQLPDLIMHEYANYMVQKLFSVCNFNQRLKIMQRIHEQICPIVRNKQGTHTIQALIKLFTNDQQYGLMCESIKSNFLQLSIHPNATHFIQKIITLFPIQHTFQFYDYAAKNFLLFALDKNGMCVIKHMMIRVSQIEAKENPAKIKQLTNQAKKHFINQVTFNIDRIIQDAFGNYIIQFCYDYFGQDKCSGITEMIIERFPQFSLQKYSSSVVLKCISSFWNQKQSLNRLKQALNGDAIVQMYRSRDGNRILLQIMERHDNSSIRDKIYNQLVMGQPTKFNHDRWGVVLGIRSGTVGTEWTSFSDAVKKSSPFKAKKKHYN